MPQYIKRGLIPKKRHTQIRNKNGELYFEEHISREGFSYIYSNVYHLRMPTRVKSIGSLSNLAYNSKMISHRARHLMTANLNIHGDAITSRNLLLYNNDLLIYKSHPSESMNYLYRNGHFDELYYIQEGRGVLYTNFGDLSFSDGDYIIVPRGVIYRFEIHSKVRCLIIESKAPIEIPSRYRSRNGQMLEHAPYCERDMVLPDFKDPIDDESDTLIKVRLDSGIQEYIYANHPFDLVGYDGYYFPWKLNINDFEPITGSIHQPPPVHQTFSAKGFVVCSFVSRLFDYHPESIPAPYPHSNLDSDEVIFYSKGDFMSRKGIHSESITLHPMGLPHGPQPGKYEESIGKKMTDELAVMIDTFKPLNVASSKINKAIDDKEYPLSWLKE